MNQDTHNEAVRRQFTKQGAAYRRLKYVHDETALSRVVKMMNVSEAHRVVDFACGPGYLALAFAEMCREVVGIDLTPAFLKHARGTASQRGLKNVRFIEADVNKTGLKQDGFDLAISRAAFHHFERPGDVLDEMIRVTKPGGRIAVLDMLTSEEPDKATRHHEIEQLCDPAHVRALTETEFLHLFKEKGLSIDFKRNGETTYSLDAWIDHGGPSEANEQRIREIFEETLSRDILGLPAHAEQGEIFFSHPGIAVVGRKAVAH